MIATQGEPSSTACSSSAPGRTRRPRVATLLHHPLSQPGGVSRFAAGLLSALERDFAGEFILIAPPGERAAAGQRRSQFWLAIQQAWQLGRVRPDIVQNHEHPALLLGAVIYRALAGRRVRVVNTIHTDYVKRRSLWKRLAFGWLMLHCDVVTAVSADTASRLQLVARPVPPRVRVIRGGGSVRVRRRDEPEVIEYQARLGLGGGPVLCQVSQFVHPAKVDGLLLLIRAMAGVRAEHPTARLLLVGDGPLRPRIEATIAEAGLGEAVVLAGYQDDVSLALGLADIYCHATLMDACPVSVLEAMLCGKPIVASRTGGIPELISDGVTGLLVGPAAAEIALTINRLLADPAVGRALGARAAEVARREFTWQRVASDYAEVYGLAR